MYSNRSCAWFSTGGLKTICIVDGNTGNVLYVCYVGGRSCLIVFVLVKSAVVVAVPVPHVSPGIYLTVALSVGMLSQQYRDFPSVFILCREAYVCIGSNL